MSLDAFSFLRKSAFAAQALQFHISFIDGYLTLPIGDLLYSTWPEISDICSDRVKGQGHSFFRRVRNAPRASSQVAIALYPRVDLRAALFMWMYAFVHVSGGKESDSLLVQASLDEAFETVALFEVSQSTAT